MQLSLMAESFKNRIIKNWNAMRLVRLALSLMVLYQALLGYDVFLGIIGGFVFGQTVLNLGCCNSSGCSIHSMQRKSVTETENINFEEIK